MPTPNVQLDGISVGQILPNGKFDKGKGRWRVILDDAEVVQLRKRLRHLETFLSRALSQVNPEFGAYMPYSKFPEGGTKYQEAQPSILPAIEMNREYIRRELQRRVGDYALTFATSKAPTLARARKVIEGMWEEVLNAKPRADAQSMAAVLYGFHRDTIRAYGKQRPMAEMLRQGNRLNKMRDEMIRTHGSDVTRIRMADMQRRFQQVRQYRKRK